MVAWQSLALRQKFFTRIEGPHSTARRWWTERGKIQSFSTTALFQKARNLKELGNSFAWSSWGSKNKDIHNDLEKLEGIHGNSNNSCWWNSEAFPWGWGWESLCCRRPPIADIVTEILSPCFPRLKQQKIAMGGSCPGMFSIAMILYRGIQINTELNPREFKNICICICVKTLSSSPLNSVSVLWWSIKNITCRGTPIQNVKLIRKRVSSPVICIFKTSNSRMTSICLYLFVNTLYSYRLFSGVSRLISRHSNVGSTSLFSESYRSCHWGCCRLSRGKGHLRPDVGGRLRHFQVCI